jgi:hypothetical protein
METRICAFMDRRPRFPLPIDLVPRVDPAIFTFTPSIEVLETVRTWCKQYRDRTVIAEILSTFSSLTQFVEAEAARNPSFYDNWNTAFNKLIPLMNQCLELAPEDGLDEEDAGALMQEAVRYACHMFFTHIRRMFGIHLGPALRKLRLERWRRLKNVIIRSAAHWDHFIPMLRWVLFTAGLEAKETEDQVWAAAAVLNMPLCNSMTPDDHWQAVKRFIWFKGVDSGLLSTFLDHMTVEYVQSHSC